MWQRPSLTALVDWCLRWFSRPFEPVGKIRYCSLLRPQIYARSNPGEPPEYCTLFNHMVKSGGSTIKDKLEESALADSVEPPGVCRRLFVLLCGVSPAVAALRIIKSCLKLSPYLGRYGLVGGSGGGGCWVDIDRPRCVMNVDQFLNQTVLTTSARCRGNAQSCCSLRLASLVSSVRCSPLKSPPLAALR